MRILHVSIFRTAPPGIVAQLSSEIAASKDPRVLSSGVRWDTVTLICDPKASRPEFALLTPFPFRRLRIATLALWVYIFRVNKRYDLILLRYPMGDLFSWIFAPFIRNLITVHHTKEIEELHVDSAGLKRIVMSFVETRMQRFAYRRSLGVIGVTDEIRRYELERFPRSTYSGVYPNGIDMDAIAEISDKREDRLQVAFISSEFFPWQGLDILFSSMASLLELGQTDIPIIHLVGNLNEEQAATAVELNLQGALFSIHGQLSRPNIEAILESCHAAIGSLALERKGLTEASTLKVREYLACGLPVYASHRDVGLPEDFPFFWNDDEPSVVRLIQFAERHRSVERSSIRNASARFISKTEILKSLAEDLQLRLEVQKA